MARQHDIEEGISPGIESVVVQFMVETLPWKAKIKVVRAI